MWFYRKWQPFRPATYMRRKVHFIDRNFQLRYTLMIVGAVALGLLSVAAPIYYFLNQNYNIFSELSYGYAPDLLGYLERERLWMNGLLFSICVGLLIFFVIIGFKITERIIAPIKILRNHLKQLTTGRWNIPPIHVRENDEFQDIIETYNYFYQSFRITLKKDLELLKTLHIDSENRDGYKNWQKMIEEKSLQLDQIEDYPLSQPIFLSDASLSEDPASHDAS